MSVESLRGSTPQHTTFLDPETRTDEMFEEVDRFLELLVSETRPAQTSAEVDEYITVAANLPGYSVHNQILIRAQCPNATHLEDYDEWNEKYNRTVNSGETAVWVRKPIRGKECPTCGNSLEYHRKGKVSCSAHEETDTGSWWRGVVGFYAKSVYDISQTSGEEIDEPQWELVGDGHIEVLRDNLKCLYESSSYNLVQVNASDWENDTMGEVGLSPMTLTPRVRVCPPNSVEEETRCLLRQYAHAYLWNETNLDVELSAKPLSAALAAVIVATHFGLNPDWSRIQLDEWEGDSTDAVERRLKAVRGTANALIGRLNHRLLDTL